MSTRRTPQILTSSIASLACACALVALGGAAQAKVQPAQIREDARTAVREFQREHPEACIDLDPATGLARRVSNLSAAAIARVGAGHGHSVEEVNTFLTERRAMLLGDRRVEELQVSQVEDLATSSHVRYQQTYRGLPVWGARVSVHLDDRGQVRMAQSSVQPAIEIDTTPAVKPTDAIAAAHAAVGGTALRSAPKIELGVLPASPEARLAYRVTILTTDPADWRVFIDARSGAVLSKADRMMHADPQGVVVDENLLTTPQPVRRPFVHLDGQEFLQGAFANVWSFTRIDSQQGRIFGRHLALAKEGAFTAMPADPAFDEQMLYYHVTRMHDFFRNTFDFKGRDHSLIVVAHFPKINEDLQVVGPLDNASYSPTADLMYFGDGTGADNGGINATSRDSDVICHEYTHAVVHKIVDLIGPAGERDSLADALNEAYADYFACSINNDPELAEFAQGQAKGLRSLANDHRNPTHVNLPQWNEPEAHWTGLIWGGACWDLRAKVGAAVADALVFRSLYYQPDDGSANFATAARGLLEADQALYGGAHEAAIREVVSQRGLMEPTPEPKPDFSFPAGG